MTKKEEEKNSKMIHVSMNPEFFDLVRDKSRQMNQNMSSYIRGLIYEDLKKDHMV